MKKLFFLLSMITILQTAACKINDSDADYPTDTLPTEVPDEFVGSWEHGSIDFVFWENYREGNWAGRNATPSREAMIIYKNGEAKYYRYEFAFGLYEQLIDCTGTVTFSDDGTFTFTPVRGRRRYYNTRYSSNNKDGQLTSKESTHPKLTGKRKYSYLNSSTTPVLQITVPGSAPYNWYKKV